MSEMAGQDQLNVKSMRVKKVDFDKFKEVYGEYLLAQLGPEGRELAKDLTDNFLANRAVELATSSLGEKLSKLNA